MSKTVSIDGFEYNGDGCDKCFTDGLHEHTRKCPTLQGKSAEEIRWATMSYADREAEEAKRAIAAESENTDRQTVKSGRAMSDAATSTASGGPMVAFLDQKVAIEISHEERAKALKLASKGLAGLKNYITETEGRQRIAAQAAELMGIRPA